jgi:MFS superfamily sulfate permease-like transporter
LLAVVTATAIVTALDLASRAGVRVLGLLPQRLPAFSLPMIRLDDVGPVLFGGLAVALVSLADTSALSRTYAARAGSVADPNQEMMALGAANWGAASRASPSVRALRARRWPRPRARGPS